MKLLNPDQLKPNPIVQALLKAKGATISVSGYVVENNQSTISISKNLGSKTYCEYPREAIVAAYQNNKKSKKVTLIVLQDADVRYIKHAKAKRHDCSCNEDGEIGVAEARPWKSIHPELAKQMALLAKMMASVGTGPGATYLSCGEKFSDCMREGGTEEDCRFDEEICIQQGKFG